jgi:hypothetical protein
MATSFGKSSSNFGADNDSYVPVTADQYQAPTSQADTSLGTLFAGIGQGATAVAGAVDINNQNNIKQNVNEYTDRIRREYGVNDAETLQADVTQPTQPLPADLVRSQSNLKDLNDAVSQGRMSQTYYYARLQTMTRQLYARYPSYRDVIDQTVQNVTGVTPANALQKSIMSDAEEAKTQASSKQNQFINYVQTNEKDAPPNVWQRLNSGELNEMDVRSYVAANKQQQAGVEATRAQLSLMHDQKQLNQEDAYSSAVTETSGIVNKVLGDATSQAGKNFASFQQTLAKAGADKNYTADEMQALTSAFGELKANTLLSVNGALSSPWTPGSTQSYASTLPPDRLKAVRDQAMSQLNVFEDALTNKNFGILNQTAAYLEAQKNDVTGAMLKGPGGQILQKVQGLRQIAGDQYINTFLMANPEALSATVFSVKNAAVADIGTGTKTLTEGIQDVKTAGVTDPKAYRALVDTTVSSILDKNIAQPALENFINKTYGADNYNVFAQFKQSERLQLYSKLTSPAVTARVAELGKTNPALVDTYKNWAYSRFASLFKSEADNIQSAATGQDMYEVKYDPKTSQFSINPTAQFANDVNTSGRYSKPYMWDFLGGQKANDAAVSINKMNQAITSLKPVLALDGADPTNALASLFQTQGINLNAPKSPGFFDSMGRAVLSATGTQPEGDNVPNFNLPGKAGQQTPDVSDIRLKKTDIEGENEWDRRADGSRKGYGFLGVLKRPDGRVSSEISVGVDIGGKETEIPTLVPTLTRGEVDQLLSLKDGERIPRPIIDKAIEFAQQRISRGLSVFATPDESNTGDSNVDLNSPLANTIKDVENGNLTGFKDGKFYPHKSVEGGTPTIAYGYKLSPGEVATGQIILSNGDNIDFSDGITPQEADKVLSDSFDTAKDRAQKQWDNKSGSGLKFNELDPKYQDVLGALTFNTGSLVDGGKFGWPKLAEAIEAGDDAAVRSQMVTSYKTPEGKVFKLSTRAKKIADALGIT